MSAAEPRPLLDLGILAGALALHRDPADLVAATDPASNRAAVRRMLAALHPAWHADAACAGMPADVFFPTVGRDAREARAVCASCSVSVECLAAALAGDSTRDHGIWAGTTARQRRKLRTAQTPASPDATTRPEEVNPMRFKSNPDAPDDTPPEATVTLTRVAPVSLATLAVEVDQPVNRLARRLGDKVFVDERTGLRCVTIRTCREFLAEREARRDAAAARHRRITAEAAAAATAASTRNDRIDASSPEPPPWW